jgi:bifunctional non-homologous end joining protein LigD
MLAREAERPFDAPAYLFEVKWDGYRCLLEAAPDPASPPRLWSRGGRDLAATFPALAAELPRDLPAGTVLDGEVVALDGARPSYDRLRRGLEPLVYVAFDCLRRGREDLLGRALLERREILADLAPPAPRRVRSEGVVGAGRAFFAAVAARDLEGMMAKRTASPYLPGVRSRHWLKVVNYTEAVLPVAAVELGPAWRPVEAVHLRLGPPGALCRLGGVPAADGERLLRAAAALARRPGVWARGRDVGRPAPSPLPRTGGGARRAVAVSLPGGRAPRRLCLEVAGRVVEVGHPGKILIPGAFGRPAVTKADLVAYYRAVAAAMLPHLWQRPLTFTRWPHGVLRRGFYQKNRPPGTPAWIRSQEVRGTQYVLAECEADLAVFANWSAVEIHAPLARLDRDLRPDLLVVDLDPMAPAGWSEVRRGARAVRVLLDRLGLVGVPKTSGATGLHVYVPVAGQPDSRRTAAWARALATVLARADPSLFTVTWRVADRRGVYVDYNQNAVGRTMAAPYSVRARVGAPVSTPLTWQEVERRDPTAFTLHTVPDRLREVGDRFARALGPAQDTSPLDDLARSLGMLTDRPRTGYNRGVRANTGGTR